MKKESESVNCSDIDCVNIDDMTCTFNPTDLTTILFTPNVDSLFTHFTVPNDNRIHEIVTRDRENYKMTVLRKMGNRK